MRTTWVSCLLLFSLVTGAPSAAVGHVATDPHVQKPDAGGGAAHDAADAASDSLWMISTRHLDCSCGKLPTETNLRFFRYDPACGWHAADEDQWAQGEWADALTLVYVHGNRIEPDEAPGRGLAAYRALLRSRPDTPPIRFVVWSWPSSKIHGPRPRRDAQAKASRTDCESYLLAQFLNGLEADTPLRLLGYSFGARIVSGALHLTGGGTLGRLHLAEVRPRPANSVRVVLHAAAMHNHWWLPGGYHDQCFSQVERLLLLYSTCDPVLRFYPRLDPRRPAHALGYTGLVRPARLGQDAERLEQANVCCQIGKTHDEQAYQASETLMRRVRESLLGP